MSIPAELRRVLESGDPSHAPGEPTICYLVYGDHLTESLEVYSVDEYEKLVAAIDEMDDDDEEKEFVTQYMIAQVQTLSVDKDGRVVLPLKRREKLGVPEGELMLRGKLDHFEIWKADRYEVTVKSRSENFLASKGANYNPRRAIKKKKA
jgi:MraZ protein